MMPACVLLAQFLLPGKAVKLGRFVTNVDEPHRDYHDPACDSGFDVTEKLQTHYDSFHHSANHRTFATDLTSFLSSSFSKRAKESVRISAEQVKTYYLNNTGQWFRDAVKLEASRKWLERTIDEGDDIYFVVGYHTILDARIVEQSGGQGMSSGNLVIPVSAALAAAGIVVPYSNLADSGLAGSRGRMEDEQRHFIARGEQICAVQYRKVRHRWFTSSKLDKMSLEKETRWERYDRPRYLDNDAEDVVEVQLEDGVALEGDRDKCTIGPEGDFFSATNLVL
jgi:hypothetical protein